MKNKTWKIIFGAAALVTVLLQALYLLILLIRMRK